MTKHEFEQLKKGDITGYHSHSEADMAFCEYLASRGATAEEIDREYRTSGLMRDKWDRKQQGATYGSITIEKSIKKTNRNA